MAETQIVTEDNGTATDKQERTFSQAEVNAMVQSRIADVKGKYADYDELKEKASKFDAAEEANKSELQKATERADALQKQIDSLNKDISVRAVREKVASEMNIPVNLLNGEDEESCKAQAKAILDFAKPNNYPSLKDDGEVQKVSNKSNGQLFGDWLNQNLK